eukprot:2714110-Rhodomonas_salina.1
MNHRTSRPPPFSRTIRGTTYYLATSTINSSRNYSGKGFPKGVVVPMSGVAAYPLYVLRRLRAPRAVGAYSVTRG